MRRMRLVVDLKNGSGPREMYTNMISDTEWERIVGYRTSLISDKGLGDTDYCIWAYTLCRLAGDKMPPTWTEWVEANPDMTIEVDLTWTAADNPNPTTVELPADS